MESQDLKKLAIDANGETWTHLQNPSRTPDERDRMAASAYASLYLWEKAGGTALNQARGHWLISRVHCIAGNPELAARHAQLCDRYTQAATDRKDFDDVYAMEAQARAAAMNREFPAAARLKAQADQRAQAIQDPEDKQLVLTDLASEP